VLLFYALVSKREQEKRKCKTTEIQTKPKALQKVLETFSEFDGLQNTQQTMHDTTAAERIHYLTL